MTAESQDLQVINLSDSESNIEIDVQRLNSFYNDVLTTDEYVSFISHFEGGGRQIYFRNSECISVKVRHNDTYDCKRRADEF